MHYLNKRVTPGSKAMRVNNKLLSIFLAAGIATCISTPLYLTGCAMKEKEETEQVTVAADQDEKTNEKATVEPIRLEDDFYGYVNAETLRNTDLNMKYAAAGSFVDCELKTQAQLDSVIEKIASGKDYENGSNEQLIHDYYEQVEDFDKEKSNATATVKEILSDIFHAQNTSDLLKVAGKIASKLGLDKIFGFSVSDSFEIPTEYTLAFQGPQTVLGVEFSEIAKGEKARVQLRDMTIKTLRAIGMQEEEARRRAEALTILGIDLASRGPSPTFNLDKVSYLSDEQIEKIFPAKEYTESMGIRNPYGKWALFDKDFFPFLAEKWNDEKNLEAFQTWLAVSVLQNTHTFLSSEYAELEKVFGENTLSRDEYAKELIKQDLSLPLGEEYSKAFYPKETDQKVLEMCEQIRSSYREVISGADWLSDETREGLLNKLENLKFITGNDLHKTDPEDAKLIGKDLWETRMNLQERLWKGKIESLLAPRERKGQSMTPQTVNACYWVDNVVRITIAIVNEPFFSKDADPATNLGGLGMVIGHEIGHAFDSNGLNWDANGCYNPGWISEKDREELRTRAQKCVDYYSGYKILGVYHVDGELTLGENYADLGAMEVITNIARTKPEREKLFENYAKIWSSLNSDVSAISALRMDEHSPDCVRCNAVLSSCPAFYETYEIQEKDGMYVPQEKRVSRW